MTRERLLFDFGWKFHRGEVVTKPPRTHIETYMVTKAGLADGPAALDFNDWSWQTVNLPHDWVVEGTFSPEENVSHGYLPRGVAWYRRGFQLSEADRDKHLTVEFDGVATHCTVWLNGQLLYRNWCGYTGFQVDISDMAMYGEALNTLVVRVDGDAFEGWWYEGAGIYRHVWLVKTNPVHVAQWGTWVNPTKIENDDWFTPIETTLENSSYTEQTVLVEHQLLNPTGDVIDTISNTITLPARRKTRSQMSLTVTTPQLWSLESPQLHRLETKIYSTDKQLLDTYTTNFGYRSLRFEPDSGFYLNDQPIKLKGTCNHQDHAGVGVALPDMIQEYRLKRLLEMGCNAYRCSHNPPTSELLDACDRLGMLVLDETRHFDSSEEGLRQLEMMIRRDRNHPAVIMWGIFNEEPLQGTEMGKRMGLAMIERVKSLDTTRPITASMNGGFFEDGVAKIAEVMGFNYSQPMYDRYHAERPHIPLLGSETASTVTTRGIYTVDETQGYCVAYDEMSPPWGEIARTSWQMVNSRAFVMGEFVWTGFDYRGEPTPYSWPCINSHFGIMDTCGFAKDAFHLYRAMWRTEPVLHLFPHWNWSGREGGLIKVMGYTNCETAELFLNDQSLGEQSVNIYEQPQWEVPYEPGTLRLEGRIADKTVLTQTITTTADPHTVQLLADRTTLQANHEDVALITVSVFDNQGRAIATADNLIQFRVIGPATIIGVGNGDPSCHEPDKAEQRSLFNGLAQVIVQTTTQPGEITLIAEAEGLISAELSLTSQATDQRPCVPLLIEPKQPLINWFMTQVMPQKPTMTPHRIEQDVNTWEPIRIGYGPQALFNNNPGYALYSTRLEIPYFNPQTNNLILQLDGVMGLVETVSVAGITRTVKTNSETGHIQVTLTEVTPGQQLPCLILLKSDGPQGGITGSAWLLLS